jgi:hypothetical protein
MLDPRKCPAGSVRRVLPGLAAGPAEALAPRPKWEVSGGRYDDQECRDPHISTVTCS